MERPATPNLEADLEEGQPGHTKSRKFNYIRDITFKIIPICMFSLVAFALGAILYATFSHNEPEPLPHQGTLVIAILILIFFVLFAIGGFYIYVKKRYPPLTEGPNAPDRPPLDESFHATFRKIHNILTDIHNRIPMLSRLGADDNQAELERPQPLASHPTHGHATHQQREKPVPPDQPARAHPVGPRPPPPSRYNRPRESTIFERHENDTDTRAMRQNQYAKSNVFSYGYPDTRGEIVNPMAQSTESFHHNPSSGHPSRPSASSMNGQADVMPNRQSHPYTTSAFPPRNEYNGGYSVNLVRVPDNIYDNRRLFEELEEIGICRHDYTLNKVVHGFESGKLVDEWRYYKKHKNGSKPTYLELHTFVPFYDDVLETGPPSYRSHDSYEAPLPSQPKNEPETCIATSSKAELKKHPHAFFNGHDNESKRSRKRHSPSSSTEKKVNDSAKPSSSEKRPVQERVTPPSPLTPPPSTEDEDASSIKANKASPKTVSQQKIPVVAKDDKPTKDLPSSRASKTVSSAKKEDQEESVPTKGWRRRQRQSHEYPKLKDYIAKARRNMDHRPEHLV